MPGAALLWRPMLQLPPLYPITDARSQLSLAEQIRRLGDAGFPLVQFRGKPLDVDEQWRQLRTALADSEANGGWPQICVNDRADLAVLAAREGLIPWGLHLGQGDLPPVEARCLPGLGGIHLGTSTHEDREWNAVDEACDHAGLGPFRATSTKGDHAAPIGLEGLRRGCAALLCRGLSPVAIGGLVLADAEACFQAGAASLAMVGEIHRAASPSELLWKAQHARWRVRPPLAGAGVALIGGSGSGKSALARVLASRLGLAAIDLDEEVERRARKPISRIFAEDGEAAFRSLEEHCLASVIGPPRVLALGGGAWENPENRRWVREGAFQALWIAEHPCIAWERVARCPSRPLALEREPFMARWRARTLHWGEAPMVLPLGRSPEALAVALIGA